MSRLFLFKRSRLTACILSLAFFAWILFVPQAFASPGCQALNGLSGTLGAFGYAQLLQNSQQVNQGDLVTVTTSGPAFYGGSFINILLGSAGTMSGTEGGSGAGADNLSNSSNSPITYSITCVSVGPTVTGISPSTGLPGTSVTINGTGFWGTTAVNFGSTPAASFTVTYGGSGPLLTAVAPSGTSTGSLTVITDGGTASGGSFTLQAIAGSLSQPMSVAKDGSGNLYIADAGLQYLVRVPTGCTSQSCTMQLGSGFSHPAGVAVDGAGNVFMVDSGTSAVTEIPRESSTGIFDAPVTLATGLNLTSGQPAGIAVDNSDDVYVTDAGHHHVLVLPWTNSGFGAQKTIFSQAGFSPTGVAVDGDGNLYVADGVETHSVIEVAGSSQTTLVSNGGGSGSPFSVAIGNGGNLYYSDAGSGTVTMLPWSGTAFGAAVPLGSGWNTPYGLTVDGAGNVYVANNGAKSVSEVTVTTPPILSFAGTMVGNKSSDSPKTVMVENIGNRPLTFPVPGTGNNPSIATDFQLGSGTSCPQISSSSSAGTLAAGTNCALAVDFLPTQAGSLSESLVLTDDHLNAAAPGYAMQTIGLSGTAVQITLASTTPTAAIYGAAYTFTLGVTGGTGPYTLFVTSGALPPGLSVAGGSSGGALSGTPTVAGTYTFAIKAQDSLGYFGSQNYTLTVSPALLSVAVANASRVYGATNPCFTATVGGLASFDTASSIGLAYSTTATVSSAVGNYPITASMTSPNYTLSTTPGALTVTQAASSTALSASGTTATPGQSVTLTALVADSSAGSTGAPTGTISFYDGTTLLGTGILSSGTATYATTALSAGAAHSLTAVYSGDQNFTGSSSTSAVGVSVQPNQFTLNVTGTTSAYVMPGESFTYQLQVSPTYGSYAGPVSFTATGMPPGGTVTFSPSSFAANAGPQTVNVTISVPANTTAANHPADAAGRLAPLSFALFLLPFAGSLRKRGRNVIRLLCVALALAGVAGLSGCSSNTLFSPAKQSYNVTITATSGALTQSTALTITVE